MNQDKFLIVYANGPSELSRLVAKLIEAHGATGWARTETSFQGRGEYSIKLKNCSR